MSSTPPQGEDARANSASNQLYTVRKVAFMAAIAITGMMLLFTGDVTFRLGATGRDIHLPATVVATAGVIGLLAATFITAEHFSRSNVNVPETHFLRQRVVLYCAWGVVVIWTIFALAGVASAA
jgi:hypothetical protein